MTFSIRSASVNDAAAIASIYNPYILTTTITFEEVPVDAAEMASRIGAVLEQGLPYLVITEGDQLLGYAYATPWRARPAYRHSVESTVYLDPEAQGRGAGSQLYRTLIDELRSRGLHTVIGGIALPNDASVGLHERLGFRKVAQFHEVGYKLQRWIDVGYWQLAL